MAKKNVVRTHRRIAVAASKVLRNSASRSMRSIAASALSNRRRTAR